jgi:transcriptional regulator with XRE-family HTH domain
MTSVAATIRRLRLVRGLTEDALARRLGISPEAYGDLERYEDELETAISLAQARELVALLGTDLATVLEVPPSATGYSVSELAKVLRADVNALPAGRSSIEEAVGWELGEFFRSPEATAELRPIMFLKALAAHVEVDWRTLLAASDAA